MTFQAGLGAAEVHFKQEPENSKPEPLRMEHFHLPLGMWVVGTLISLLFFIAEIIIHHRRKSKTSVAMLTAVEKPRVTPSTPVSDIEDTDKTH